MNRKTAGRRKFGAALIALSVAQSLSAAPPVAYTLMPFVDEFTGTAIDTARWSTGVMDYPSGGTWLRRNHAGNNSVSGGYLVQTTLYQDVTGDGIGDWTCSSMGAAKYRQRFGYWECRMKINKYSYTDSNFWSSDGSGVHLNGLDGFEIDAPEAWGTSRNNSTTGTGRYTSTIFDHSSSLYNPFEQSFSSPDISNTFNTYGWEWATDNTVKCYFNGTLLFTHSAEFFNSIEALVPQSPVLGTALWTTGYNTGPTGNSIADGDQKLVDYVRVYQKPGWIGSGAIKNWNDAANWGDDGVPGSGRAALFNTAASSGIITLPVDQPVQEITFQTGSTGLTTINGPGKLLLGATTAVNALNQGVGGINLNNDTTQSVTINADIIAQRKLQFSNFSGTTNFGGTAGVLLTLNGSISAAATGTELVFLTTGDIHVNGAIDSSIGDLTKGAQGTVTLNSANTFSGALNLLDGVIRVNVDGALGGTASGTTISDGATLGLANVNYVQAEHLVINGNGARNSGYASRQGAIDIIGNNVNASFAGAIDLGSDATISGGTTTQNSTLTLSGAINVNAYTLTLYTGKQMTLSGAVTGTGVNGEGLIIKANTGTVSLTGANSLGYKGKWQLDAGVLAINGVNNLGGGTGEIINFNGGTLRLLGALTTSKGGTFSAANGTFDTNGFSALVSGAFSGAGGFVKTGNGSLTLSGTNSYTGLTAVTAGKLVVSGVHDSTHAGYSLANASMDISGQISPTANPGPMTQTGTGTLAITTTGAARFSTINTTSAVTNNGSLWISNGGTIAGISGTGTLTLTGGTLALQAGGGVSRMSSISIAGGQLDIKNNALIVRSTDVGNAARNDLWSQIMSGQNGVDANSLVRWNGQGIASSSVRSANVSAGMNLYAVGIIANHDLAPGYQYNAANGWLNGTVTNVAADDILIRYTYNGDSNLDGSITIVDYVAIDTSYSVSALNPGWAGGDFNKDGLVTIEDYVAIDTAYAFQSGTLSETMLSQRLAQFGDAYMTQMEPIVLALSAVPEPATLGLTAIGAMALLVRRRQ